MKEIEISIGTILVKISEKKPNNHKEKKAESKVAQPKSENSRRKFFIYICTLFLTIKGRINFSQMYLYRTQKPKGRKRVKGDKRFQIEFLYRDAKQFTGLTHCQSTDADKLYYSFF